MPRDESVLLDILHAACDVIEIANQSNRETFIRNKGVCYSIMLITNILRKFPHINVG